jgi:hypothetical protein
MIEPGHIPPPSTARAARLLALTVLIATAASGSDYYVSPSGSDSASGASAAPWRSVAKVNATTLRAGDRVLFQGGQRFAGKISLDVNDGGTSTSPVTITSYGSGRAIIDGGTGDALFAYNCGGIDIRGIDFVGAGRTASTGTGINFYADLATGRKFDRLYIDGVDCSGFRSGIVIGSWHATKPGYRDVRITNVRCHDNARVGLVSYGMEDASSATWSHSNWYVGHSTFDNNTGDPAYTTNHSGSGCCLSEVDGALIERCTATANGALNNFMYAGPVGIWAYEANRVTIQFCESYANRTKAGSPDGDGFDFDGGSTNCIAQYNYSHDNDGAGFLICEFGGSRASRNNVIRYNVSENDSRTTWQAGVQVYLGSDTQIYGNTLYCGSGTAPQAVGIRVNGGARTVARNNLIVTSGRPMLDVTADTVVQGNGYWNYAGGFAASVGGGSFASLSALHAAGYERLSGVDVGRNVDPLLTAAGAGGTIGNPDNLTALSAYKLRAGSPMVDAGIDLAALGVSAGGRDYWGDALPQGARLDIGVDEMVSTTLPPPVPAPVITSVATASGTAGQPFSYAITASNAPTAFAASGLPGGLSVNSATGVISGSPTGSGSWSVAISASNAGGTGSAVLAISIAPAPVAQQPYGGAGRAIPGIIEGEDFDLGGEGVAYHDVDAANNGGAYRAGVGVDIEATGDAGGGYDVGWIVAGEWLEYGVSIASAASYRLDARVGCLGAGGTWHLSVDGADVTGAMTIPDTGAWTAFATATRSGIVLPAGAHVLRVAFDATGASGAVGNLNRLTFTAETAPVPPPSDATAPVLSAIAAVRVSGSTATITWTTNEASDSQVQYGKTWGYGSASPLDASLVLSHAVTLTGLSKKTTYHYRVLSRDAAGNLAASGDGGVTRSALAAADIDYTFTTTGESDEGGASGCGLGGGLALLTVALGCVLLGRRP